MKKAIILIVLSMAFTLSACGQKNNNNIDKVAAVETSSVDISVAANDETIEETTVQAAVETSGDDHAVSLMASNESSSIEEVQTKPEPETVTEQIFKFVDVFGEEYETTIKVDIPKHSYQNESFSRDGSILTYDDDTYTSRLGIDVSRHQGKINWEKVKEQGVEFVFLRIGYRGYGKAGNINLDERFYENIKGAQSVGIDVGVYFFSQAINEEEALEEANFVLDSLKGYELQLPVVYDPESILDDVARTDDVSGEQFTRNTIVFCDTIRESGFEPMIYSNMLWEAFEFDLSQLSGIPIWYADYEEYPQTLYDFVFWQYTNEGRVSGIDGCIDFDIQIIKK